MDYDDFFETLDDLLATINGAVEDEVELDYTDTSAPYFSYMFDKEKDVFEELDMETGLFKLSPLH